MKKTYYITTTLPYVNAEPHIGFAREILEADVLARWHKILGEEVIFNTGTDEHGQKIYDKALEEGKSPKEYCDFFAAKFDELGEMLNLKYNNFIRTTDEHHMAAAQEIWRRCEANGDIYKKEYKVKYCVGCELEKTDSELTTHGTCPDHPNKELEIREEENYFFRWSKYKEKLLDLYKKNPEFVVPQSRMNEVKSFVERGLQDFSISRLKEKMPWGIAVPGDEDHVMYVWFDALTNYISTLGWPEDEENFQKFWPAVQVCGKDNTRQQSAMWQAMLLSAGIEPSKQILVNGFITAPGGQKMSKSLGNVISPQEMVDRYGVDGTRYLLLTLGTFGADTEVSWELLDARYNADLANGLGNLASRVLTLAKNIGENGSLRRITENNIEREKEVYRGGAENLKEYQFAEQLESIWNIVREANKYMEENKPWELKKTDPEKFKKVMKKLLEDIQIIAESIASFMPETSERILKMVETGEKENLFGRVK